MGMAIPFALGIAISRIMFDTLQVHADSHRGASESPYRDILNADADDQSTGIVIKTVVV